MDQDEIFIDDPRNARVRVVRHPSALRPGTYPVAGPRVMPPAYPAGYYQPAPVMAYPPAAYQPASMVVPRATRFADLSTGEVLALAAQAFAALQSLPSAPAPIGSTETDVANLITYQSALAQHAKRDEQLRTVGSLLSKLLA